LRVGAVTVTAVTVTAVTVAVTMTAVPAIAVPVISVSMVAIVAVAAVAIVAIVAMGEVDHEPGREGRVPVGITPVGRAVRGVPGRVGVVAARGVILARAAGKARVDLAAAFLRLAVIRFVRETPVVVRPISLRVRHAHRQGRRGWPHVDRGHVGDDAPADAGFAQPTELGIGELGRQLRAMGLGVGEDGRNGRTRTRHSDEVLQQRGGSRGHAPRPRCRRARRVRENREGGGGEQDRKGDGALHRAPPERV
jgi:hypothetical protein